MARTPVTAPNGEQIFVEHEPWHTPEQILTVARNQYYGQGFFSKVKDWFVDMPAEEIPAGLRGTASGTTQLLGSAMQGAAEADIAKDDRTTPPVFGLYGMGIPTYGALTKPIEDLDAAGIKKDSEPPKAPPSVMSELGDRLVNTSQEFRDKSREARAKSKVDPKLKENIVYQATSSIVNFLPSMLVTGGLSSFAQMADETLVDAENSMGKRFVDMTDEEKDSVAAATGMNAFLGGSIELFGGRLLRLTPFKVSQFIKGKAKLPNGAIKTVLQGALGEGLTESAQGQIRDTIANYYYDDDRKLIGWDVAKNRFHEFVVGGLAGGMITGGLYGINKIRGGEGTQSGEADTGGEGTGGSGADGAGLIDFTVEYTDTDGTAQKVVISSNSAESARKQFMDLRQDDETIDTEKPIIVSELSQIQEDVDEDGYVPDPESTEVDEESGTELDPIFDKEGQLVGWKPTGTETPANLTQLEMDFDGAQDVVPGQGVPQPGVKAPMMPKPRRKPKIAPARSQGRAAPKVKPEYRLPRGAGKMAPKWYGQEIEFDNDLTKAIYGSRGAKTSNLIMTSLKSYGLSEGSIADLKRKLNADARAQAKKGGPIRLSLPAEIAGARTLPMEGREKRMRDSIPNSRFGNVDDFKALVEGGTWGTLTGENPGNVETPEAVNKQLNEKAFAWLKDRGYDPIPTFGKYDGPENSFLVPDLTLNDAVEFSRVFNQQSVATDKGLVYPDATMNPRAGMNKYSLEDNYYSTIRINDQLQDFQVMYDYNNFVDMDRSGMTADPVGARATYIPIRYTAAGNAVPPPFFQRFNPEQYEEGRFVDLETKQDLSDKTYQNGRISIVSGRPVLETSDNEAENVIPVKPSNNELGTLVKTNLYKQKGGKWKWIDAPEGAPDTIVSVEGKSDLGTGHVYTLDFVSNNPLTLKTYPKSMSEPRGRPTTRGYLQLGNIVGRIYVNSAKKTHPVYDRITVGEETAEPVGARSLMTPDQVIETADKRIYSFRGKDRFRNRVDTDPGEGGKVRTIGKMLRIPKKDVIGWESLKENVIQKAADRIRSVMEKASNLFPSFESWYVGRINMAMDIYSELDPRLKNDEDSFLFKVILAVTSNGNEVEAQATDTYKIYQRFKNTGTFRGSRPSGDRTTEIKEHLMLFEGLLKAHGWKKVKKFFDTEGSVSELRERLSDDFGLSKENAIKLTKGELIDEVVPFSLIFGPKLGSFYNNLNGKLDTTTMDRWFMRTFGRTMGTQFLKIAKEDVQAAYDRYNNAIDNLPEDSFLKQRNINIRKNPSSSNLKAITKHFEDKANREGMGKGEPFYFSPENEFRKAANNLIKKMDGLQILESPRGGMHRRFIRRVMDRALKDYNKLNGTNFSPAEIQALLWYYEKEVHDAFGSKQKDKAPDYATAANTLFREINGKDSKHFTESNLIGGGGGGLVSSNGGRGGAVGSSEGRTGDTGAGTGVQEMAEPTGAAPGNRAFNKPLEDAASISIQYSQESGITFEEPTKIRSVNEARAKRIADAYDSMQDNPTDPEVAEAYQAMADETIAQYKTIIANGYRVDANNKEYGSSYEMIEDLRNRKIMNIFSTEEGFGDEPITEQQRAENPLLQDSGFKDISGRTLLVNDVFRFVHDFFGHAKLGNGFGKVGEENAWNVHSRMYTMKARRAMTTETRGQNSWVNFSGVNEESFSYRDIARQLREEGKPQEAKKYSDKAYEVFRFADQKINLLPNEFVLTDEEIAAGKTEADVVGSTPSASSSEGEARTRVVNSIKKLRRVIEGLKVNVKVGDTGRDNPAIYDPNTRTVIIDPVRIEGITDDAVLDIVREEMIHAAKHRVAMNMHPKLSPAAAWNKVMGDLGKALTSEQRSLIENMYGQELSETNAGAEYFRAAIQELLYGRTTEQSLFQGKAGEMMARIIKRIQQFVSRALGKDIKDNPDAARLIVDTADMLMRLDPDARPANQKTIDQARKLIDKGPGAEAALDVITPTPIELDISGDNRKSREVNRVADSAFFTVLSIFKKIHPALQGPVNRWANQIKIRTSDNQERVRNFAKKIHKLPNTREGIRLRQVLTYSPITDDQESTRTREIEAERKQLLQKFGLLAEYQVNVRPVLDKLYAEAAAAGIDVEYIENYFPRVVKDIKGLRESMSSDELQTFDEILRAENKRRREANEPEIESRSAEAGGLLHDFIMGKLYGPSGEIQPGFIQKRELDMIPEDKLKYYATPAEALMFRIKEMIAEIENTKTFGRLRKDGKREQVGEFYQALAPLVEAGNVTTEALDVVPGLINNMLRKTKAEWTALQVSRTISYLQLINPTSVLSQVYEFALTLNKDPVSAVRAVVDVARGVDSKELAKIGINPVSDEFFYGGGTEAGAVKFLNKSLENGLKSIGFSTMDRIMKTVNLRADYLRLRKEAENLKRNPDSYRAKKFKRLLQDQMYVRWQETYADLLSGKRNSPYVRDMLLTEMRKTQPLTDLEKTYLEQKNPNWRSLYTLKRFMITQLTYVRENTYDVLRDPNASARDKAEAVKFMLSLTAFMLMVGMPVDALKDWIAGRAGYIDDYTYNSALRLFGISKYNLYSARKQGLVRALIDAYILPVGAQQLIDLTTQTQALVFSDDQEAFLENLKNVKALNATPLDDFWYYRWGKGAEMQEYKRKQRFKEDGVFPVIEPYERR